MRKRLFIFGFIVLKLASPGQAQIIEDTNWVVNTVIPNGNPVGITLSETFNNISSAPITNIDVNLNISGGNDADLYVELVLQDANGNVATETLLNQVGTSPSNPLGSSVSGLNVTLSDSGTANGSIHWATGIPTGTWLPDSANTLDGTFGGLTANGTWTLFLADLSVGGGTSTLNNWGLDINMESVPEPTEPALIIGSGVILLITRGVLRRWRRKAINRNKAI